jgi:hypothetical protein
LRNFQLKYAPAAFNAEADAWRIIIDLNLVRSVTFLLSLLGEGDSGGSSPRSPSDANAGPTAPSGRELVPLQHLTDDLRRLRVSLSPLKRIEQSLSRFISPDNPRSASLPTERAFEVSVRSGSRWKTLFRRNGGSTSSVANHGQEEVQNARSVIEACREDMISLWNHPAVRASLAEQSVALEFQSGLCVPNLSLVPLFFSVLTFFFPVTSSCNPLALYPSVPCATIASLMRWIGLQRQDTDHHQVRSHDSGRDKLLTYAHNSRYSQGPNTDRWR